MKSNISRPDILSDLKSCDDFVGAYENGETVEEAKIKTSAVGCNLDGISVRRCEFVGCRFDGGRFLRSDFPM